LLLYKHLLLSVLLNQIKRSPDVADTNLIRQNWIKMKELESAWDWKEFVRKILEFNPYHAFVFF